MTNETRNNEPEVVTSIRLTRKQHEKLKRIAAREERSASQQMRYLIDHLDGEPDDHGRAAA